MIAYQLAEQEVVGGLLKYRRTPVRFWFRIIVGIFGLGLLLSGLQMPSRQSERFVFLGAILLVVSIGALLFAPLLVRQAFSNVVRRNSVFTDPKEVTFDERGLLFRSPTHKSEVSWTAFKRISQDDRYFYLHSDDLGNVTLLPKRAFDEAALQNFLRCSRHLSAL